jgi:hypothetical protein
VEEEQKHEKEMRPAGQPDGASWQDDFDTESEEHKAYVQDDVSDVMPELSQAEKYLQVAL